MSKDTNPILGAIDNINVAFEEFKTTNDEKLDAERKGNTAKAKELDEKLERINDDLVVMERQKRDFERREAILDDRVDLLEALNDRPKGSIQQKVRNEYKDGFIQYVRTGGKDEAAHAKMRNAMQQAQDVKDVTIGTTAAGGYAVPEEISTEIDRLMLKQSDIQNEIKNVTVGTSDYKELITIHGANSAWIGETGTRSVLNTPTLREVVPTWGELYNRCQISEWSAQDIFFDVEKWLVEDVADGFGKNVDLAIWSGDGSSKPTGMTNSAPVVTADGSPQRAAAAYQYVITDSASPTALGADDVIDLVYALNRAYRNGAKFGCNSITQGALRKLKSTNGDYYWQPSLQLGQPATLLGHPVFTYEDMPDYSTGSAIYLGFGDWKRAYTLTTRQQLAITVENVTNPGYIRYYIRRRYGGIVTNNEALKFLKLID